MTGSAGNGRRMARLFRQARELRDSRRCDLESIAAADGLEIVESRHQDPGYTACLLRAPGREKGGLIALSRGQEGGRRRFSIAHELGHYHIPTHWKVARPPCAESDFRARGTDSKKLEWEANDFAAELLMPWSLFASDAGRLDPSFDRIYSLAGADMYDVSVTAAAWRYVQVTREACVLIVIEDGVLSWSVRSKGFPYIGLERQRPVPPHSVAAAVIRGEGAVAGLEQVPFHAWLDREPHPGVEVWESTHQIPRLNQVLSLVWIPERDEEDFEEHGRDRN